MINLERLTKRFGETVAVNELSFAIEEGEIFGLIGPDGAGKTTTLRVISTAMRPTSGHVYVGGLDVTREAEAVKQLIGYMPQRFALYPDLTVVENLNFFADMFGAPAAERREQIERLLGFARLTDFTTRRAQNLSGGMQKKLALAATLMHRPRVLLLDEPTTGVDPVSRREFWDLLTQVHLEGVTIVISTPYLDEAERCTRVGLMHRGGLIACDTPTALRRNLHATVLEGQTAQARQARDLAKSQEGVLNAAMHGDVVRLLVDRPERQRALQAAWQARGIPAPDLRTVPARLEDAFVLILEGQTADRGRTTDNLPN
jgi:ABC-2 type transport system ATP-binding protein